ncbi:LapA family protein [Paenibacillus periandrae]|uniref:LapA family protein n=1 Tax=Paenibacillus periandrae TaxID=1761741 RepID=UPI001F09605B|nr:lipopolysaccharide assembly protein LapA domain-containing protein [Paenibacillus periandrae]
MKAQWILISILFFGLLTAIFAAINTEPVNVHLIFTDMQLPLIIIILSSTLLGGLILGLIGMSKQYKLKRTIKQLEKQLNEAQMAHAVPTSAASTDAGSLPLSYAAPEKMPSSEL